MNPTVIRYIVMKSRLLTLLLLLPCLSAPLQAQTALYPQHFALSEVTLLDGPFKTAMERNFQTLLSYDHRRLLTPYIRQAGLSTGDYAQWEASHPSFPNWGSADFNLDGHVGGHYLSALSLAYAACRDATTKAALKERIDYMVRVMTDCQSVFDADESGLRGFIGGQPMNAAWQALYANADIALRGTGNCAVPWYCQHKILAGLRDAYLYAGNNDARTAFLKLCDWCILVTSKLDDNQMEAMLNTEHGGVNESLLDAYQLTLEQKYLNAAKRFTHKTMLNGLQTLTTTFLDNKHANTQVPKYIGMERIGEQDPAATSYLTAATNFWTDVAQNRTVCIGGNSMYEHFLAASNAAQYINHLDGPESCNTNNMLKLSEMAFDRTHDARYADFYEYGMWNHILSTQDPNTGGYVYFTTLRPQGYRIYSTTNESMWCCVGTGMENHSKYGHFIYTHEGSSKLYVNLFTASRLANDDFIVTQQTQFPFSNTSTLTIGKGGTFTVAIRHPAWAANGFQIAVNDTPMTGLDAEVGTASYVEINRTWAEGDVITVTLPMTLRYTTCPNYTDYIAFQYGPILLAAQTSASSESEAASKHLTYEAALQNEYGHEGRMDHAPGSRAKSLPITSAPLLIGPRDGENGVLSKITATDPARLHFTLDASREGAEGYDWQQLTLQPFYQIHHARYSCYWYQQTAENYAASNMGIEEAASAAIAERTLDFVATGEQQSEAGHFTSYANSTTGNYNNEYYRDARPADGFIQYTLSYEGEAIDGGLSVLCRFTQADAGRKATLYVDDTPIANITALAAFNGMVTNGFYNVEFPIPASLMRDDEGNLKQSFVIRLAADKGTNAPGLYYLRLMKGYDPALPATVTTTAGDTRRVIDGVATGENGQDEMSHGFDFSGVNGNGNHGTYQNKYWRNGLGGEYYAYDLATNGKTEGVSLVVEYWSGDAGRQASITIDGTEIATQTFNGTPASFVILEYPIPASLLLGKQRIHVTFTSLNNSYTPGSYHVWLAMDATAAELLEQNVQTIRDHGGEATSLLMNPDCNAVDGWTGSGAVGLWHAQNWRGTGNDTDKYLDVGGLSYVKQTLTHMPAGYYTLVAALRTESNAATITPVLNDDADDTFIGMGYGAAGASMINRQGVQMPADAACNGFGPENTRGWQWGTAATHLAADGDLTIRFNLAGNGWKCVDDVHLYYSSEPDGFCAINDAASDVDASKVLTCNIVLSNPNTIVTSSSPVTTAAGTPLNNNLVEGSIGQLTLFEGHDFRIPDKNLQATAATIYRTIPSGKWATVCLPFALPKPQEWEVKELTSVTENNGIYTLHFTDAAAIQSGKPYMVRTSQPVTAITAENAGVLAEPASTTIGDVSMTGTFTPGNVPAGDYFVTGNAIQLAADNTNTINAFRAYFHINGTNPVKALLLDCDSDQTAISDQMVNGKSVNQMVNGKSVNGKCYDLAGRRRAVLQRGFNLVSRPDGSLQKRIVP